MNPQPSGEGVGPVLAPPVVLDESPRIYQVLSSHVRMEILRAVTIRKMTVTDLVDELHLHRATVRYHLASLLREGLIEEFHAGSIGRVGRPATVYAASKHAEVATFPRRRFELLGRLALETLVEAVGEEQASERLRKKGVEVSAGIIQMLASQTKGSDWTPDVFERVVLNGLYNEMGLVCEVRARASDSLVYRTFSCPFLELAGKMPKQVCDSLDQGFHDGIDRAIGGVRTTRLACMGHGSPYCEYRLEWKPARRQRVKGRGSAREGVPGDDDHDRR